MNTIFTDGNNHANSFVKELYIGANWKSYNPNEKLRLFLARNQTYPTGTSLITLVFDSSFNPQTGIVEHGFITTNNSEGVIKLDSVGDMLGVDCYILVDWEEPWILATQTGCNFNGEIDFYAEIDVTAATNLDNSPTIKEHLLNLALSRRMDYNLINELDARIGLNIAPQPQWEDFTIINTFFAYNHSDLENALKAENDNSNTLVHIMTDIPLRKELSISKNVKIDGHGHKLFEYKNCSDTPVVISGMNTLPFIGPLSPNSGFTAPDGSFLELKRSRSFRSDSFTAHNSDAQIYRIVCSALSNYVHETDNVFINVRISYIRGIYKVLSFTGDTITFEITDLNTNDTDTLINFTPHADFFLSNYDDGSSEDGVLVKNNKLFFPMRFASLHHCIIDAIFPITANSLKVDIANLTVIGGTNCCIRNYATLRLTNCELTNPIGKGIINDGCAFIENNNFHDIKEHGIISDRYYQYGIPYMHLVRNLFRNIACYGSNKYGVFSNGKAYIGYNEFVDNNYGSVYIGIPSDTTNEGCINMVEHNYIHFSPEWINKRKYLGLQDSGAIYLGLNQEKAIVRFNRIYNVGGPDEACYQGAEHGDTRKNIGIYADDGTYNAAIYGNIIQGTENYYDIDCRAETLDADKTRPEGCEISTNNFVCFNFCDGFVRIQHNLNRHDHGCIIKGNIVGRRARRGGVDKNTINLVRDYISGEAIEENTTGLWAAAILSDMVG